MPMWDIGIRPGSQGPECTQSALPLLKTYLLASLLVDLLQFPIWGELQGVLPRLTTLG